MATNLASVLTNDSNCLGDKKTAESHFLAFFLVGAKMVSSSTARTPLSHVSHLRRQAGGVCTSTSGGFTAPSADFKSRCFSTDSRHTTPF